MDEVITPQSGSCTLFARYVKPGFATQVILTARLTRLYERRDWRDRFAAARDVEPLRLERGIALDLKPVLPLSPVPAVEIGPDRALLERAHRRVMDLLEQKTPGEMSPFTDLAQMRQARQDRLESMERE